MRELALALAIAAGACRQGEPPRSSPATPRDRVRACVDAVTANLGGGHLDALPAPCASIVREPRCHAAAIVPLGRDPDAWLNAFVAACAPAYCPQLPAPRPRACTGPSASGRGDAMRDWAELWVAIVVVELGLDDAKEVAMLTDLFSPHIVQVPPAPIQSPPDPSPAPMTCALIAVGLGPDGLTLHANGRPRHIAYCRGMTDRAALFVEVCRTIKTIGCVPEVIVNADPKQRYGDVFSVLDAIKAAGVQRFQIATSGTAPPPAADDVPARCGEPLPARCP